MLFVACEGEATVHVTIRWKLILSGSGVCSHWGVEEEAGDRSRRGHCGGLGGFGVSVGGSSHLRAPSPSFQILAFQTQR